jgi:hypothetical protein
LADNGSSFILHLDHLLGIVGGNPWFSGGIRNPAASSPSGPARQFGVVTDYFVVTDAGEPSYPASGTIGKGSWKDR